MAHDRLIKIIDFITEHMVRYSFQIIGALVILAVGWILAKVATGMARKALQRWSIDITIEKFIAQSIYGTVLVLSLLLAISCLGVQIAPLIAGLSVAGVGAGLALQGPLSNYASGASLIFTKPFKVGDIIEVAGAQGEVIKNYSQYRKLEF